MFLRARHVLFHYISHSSLNVQQPKPTLETMGWGPLSAMNEITSDTITSWLKSLFGEDVGVQVLPPEPHEQWALRVEGHSDGRYGSLVTLVAPPRSILSVEVTIDLSEGPSQHFARLSLADRIAFLLDLRVCILRNALEYQITPPASRGSLPDPERITIVGNTPVGDAEFTRRDFFDHFTRVQRATTEVDILFQRLPLNRVLR